MASFLVRLESKARNVMLVGTASLLALTIAAKFLNALLLPAIIKDMPKPRVEIGAGYPTMINGRRALVFGSDKVSCVGALDDERASCRGLKVEPGASKVVTLVVDDLVFHEVWTFVADGDTVKIRRPDGSFVGAAPRS